MTSVMRTAAVAIALVACSDGGAEPAPEGLEVAYATRTCAPWDGPAVQLYLTGAASEVLPPPGDRVEISVWRAAAELGGSLLTWEGASQVGYAGWCSGDGACEAAQSVVLRFQQTGADTVLAGTLRLVFPDGRTVAGGFNAEWRPSDVMCG